MRIVIPTVVILGWLSMTARAEVKLESIISREHPSFDVRTSRLTVGRDGMVYLCSGASSFVLRLTASGHQRRGSPVVEAAANATANAAGIIATANGHFAHQVTLYSREFQQSAAANPFLVSDQVGWDAPAHVEAGASGDFYAVDQHRDRILRISPQAKLIRAFATPHEPKGNSGVLQDFRVCEKTASFHLLRRSGPLECVGFDGKLRWTLNAGVHWGEGVNAGGFDVDEDGKLYVIGPQGDTVRMIGADGKSVGVIRLQQGVHEPGSAKHGIMDLRVYGTNLLIKRRHPTELFQCYDRTTGQQKTVAVASHERLSVIFPQRVWIAGQAVPFEIRLEASERPPVPHWHVWARTLGCLDSKDWVWKNGQIEVPSEAAGVYQLAVMPSMTPRQRGASIDYHLGTWIEVRQPNTKGSVSVWTERNRTDFGRGEEIPYWVLVRSGAERQPRSIQVQLTQGTTVLAQTEALVEPRTPKQLVLSRVLTTGLLPGRFAITPCAPGLTAVPQHITIGPGLQKTPFHVVEYGDYRPIYPSGDLWEAPDVVAAHTERMSRLGMSLVVDRLGDPNQAVNLSAVPYGRAVQEIIKHLEDDPFAAAPQKAITAPPLYQMLAAYSGAGIEQMAILMRNDAGLPLGGPGFDTRKPDQLIADLERITRSTRSYPAFRGWSWSSNWWVFGGRGSAAATSPEEKAAYEAALKRAKETGAWDPVLERVSSRRLGYAVQAQELFRRTLEPLAPELITASACPYRNVESYPPVSLSNVDEVDLQAQWEQIALPYHAPHNVDFYKRPTKRAWLHPEVWNDAGTGDQIIPTLFEALMRGADGVGFSGPVPPWGALPDDPRSSYYGTASVYRSLNHLLRSYGPWLTSLKNHDRVVIVVSGRMLCTDEWRNVTGTTFARLLEAYASCLHAHHPASYVFVEDLRPDTLRRFKAALVIGQTIEPEPELAQALREAQKAGVVIFCDGTCRPALVKDFRPLGISFDHFEKDRHPASDDAAYWRFPAYCRANVPALKKALDPVATPPAQVADDEVFLTERVAEEARYLFVVNRASTDLEPGRLWRMTLSVASRMPARIPVTIDARGTIYDVFAGRQLQAQDGVVHADCRSLPARIYAVLPTSIDRVELRGPDSAVEAGQSFVWSARVLDAEGRPIRASIPLRIRFQDAAGNMIEERFSAAGSAGTSGRLTAPWNAVGPCTLEAVELFNRQGVSLRFTVTPPKLPLDFSIANLQKATLTPAREPGDSVVSDWSAVEEHFGPHIRDVVLTSDGQVALMNTMNWDHNLYAVDLNTGHTQWRQRIGGYFAFALQAIVGGFAVQGFDFSTAEGYHLYFLSGAGNPERRFALYGLPSRLPHRFVPGILNDRINQFAVAPDGSWVAAAGDLGLAVWSREGRLLWKQDWWKTRRHAVILAALGNREILVVEGAKAAAYDAASGAAQWQTDLAPTGEVQAARVSADGRTCALLARTDGGRIFLLRAGKLIASFPSSAKDAALSSDGSLVAVTNGKLLRLYSVATGLRWIFAGDDSLHAPRFAADGKRLAVSSALGTLTVLDSSGSIQFEKDMGALTVPAWLPDGDLVLATWMGTVVRLDGRYAERWRTLLHPAVEQVHGHPEDKDNFATTRIAGWGNAETQPAPLTPNLLGPQSVAIRFVSRSPTIQLTQPFTSLVDGRPEPPKDPWLHWADVGTFAEQNPFNYLLLDTFRTQLRLTGITIVEDPSHPESWLRDTSLEYWDAARESWVPVQSLLSNAAIHTHRLACPVEASRFRLVMPRGLQGNLRLGEIVFHGEKLGPSHPDVIARRPVAVLFDEGDELQGTLVAASQGTKFQFEGAYSGGRSLALTRATAAFPPFQPPFGHCLANWDFQIVEAPVAGQYRYLQFAWRATSAETRGIALQLGSSTEHGRQVGICAGEYTPIWGASRKQMAGAPPREWQVVRVDLWELFGKKPVRIQSLGLVSVGGPAVFDQILLGRSEKDLPAEK
jgi:outer membrane protein assembly factor BamB